MDTALFLFGMKLHRQDGSVEFFDADFSNTLTVKSGAFEERTLGDCCKIINEVLESTGFVSKNMTVGALKGIDDFDLRNVLVRKEFDITLRFNTFSEAMKAFKCLNRGKYTSPLTDGYQGTQNFFVKFLDPEHNYFDGQFCSKFEDTIKDRFEGLERYN